MEKFTHGIMVVDPLVKFENGDYEVVHFVGYWEEPADWDIEANRVREELRTDPDFNYDDVDRLIFYPATEGCLKYYNDMGEEDGIFNDTDVWKEKLN